MSRFNLLDCTLRDGGYINNWKFDYKEICNIIRKLIEAKTDIIEVGFLQNCEYSRDISLFNSISEVKPILPQNKGNSMYSIMVLHKEYDLSKLEQNDSTVDIIRTTFHSYEIDEALLFARKIMDKGYKVSCNLINTTGNSDLEILNLIEKINNLHPFAFSIVDTFGSMQKTDLLRIYSLVENNLDKTIIIGLHLHENLGLSYSLAQYFVDISSTNRNIIIDASLLGMGKKPGNLCIELMMDYLNQYHTGQFEINAVYDAIDDYIMPIKEKETWGYTTAFALSAKYKLHRNYSEYLLGKGKLRARDINQILAGIEHIKKDVFDMKYIEKLYLEYQNNVIDDTDSKNYLKKIVNNTKKTLVLAPGNSLNIYKSKVEQYIKEYNPIIISANYDDTLFGAQYNFYSNIRRYEQYVTNESDKTILITSNVCKAALQTSLAFNYYDLACDEAGLYDNCVIMLLRLLCILGVTEITIAGFDGFSESEPNYVNNSPTTPKMNINRENREIMNYVSKLRRKVDINFLTPSLYIE